MDTTVLAKMICEFPQLREIIKGNNLDASKIGSITVEKVDLNLLEIGQSDPNSKDELSERGEPVINAGINGCCERIRHFYIVTPESKKWLPRKTTIGSMLLELDAEAEGKLKVEHVVEIRREIWNKDIGSQEVHVVIYKMKDFMWRDYATVNTLT